MNQSGLKENTCSRRKRRENPTSKTVKTGLSITCDWLKIGTRHLTPITSVGKGRVGIQNHSPHEITRAIPVRDMIVLKIC